MGQYSGRKKQIYILTPEDSDRIYHLLGVLGMAIVELLLSKRVEIPDTPELLPAENQLMNERNDIAGEFTKSGVYSDDF
jgi:hypothetical protein